jgi:hypothetical protein
MRNLWGICSSNAKDWHSYTDFAQVLIHTARDLYSNEGFGIRLYMLWIQQQLIYVYCFSHGLGQDSCPVGFILFFFGITDVEIYGVHSL